MAHSARIALDIAVKSTDVTDETHNAYARRELTLTDGTDTDEADLTYHEIIVIPNRSAPVSINLVDGTRQDINGDDLVMREAVSVYIENKATEDIVHCNFDFGGSGYGFTIPIYPLGHVHLYAPPANALPTLSSDAPHIFLDAESGTNVNVKVLVTGRSLS